MSLNNLLKSKKLSARACNTCTRFGINSYEELLQYYIKYETFELLPHCGRKTNEELIEFCMVEIEKKGDVTLEDFMMKDPLQEIIENLSPEQIKRISDFALEESKKMKVRNMHIFYAYFGHSFNYMNYRYYKDFEEKVDFKVFSENVLLNQGFNVLDLKGVGKSSIPEWEKFFASVKDFIHKIGESNEEEVAKAH